MQLHVVSNMTPPFSIHLFDFLLLHPCSLSGCPIAAAEKLTKGHDKQHLSQPGSEHLKGSPNDRVLRWVIETCTSVLDKFGVPRYSDVASLI